MHKIISFKELLVIVLVSALFAEFSWWVLLSQQRARQVIRNEISESFTQAQNISLTSLPNTLALPLLIYMPFWITTFGLIRIFINLEKNRSSSLIHQQEI